MGNVQSAGNKITTIADYTREHDIDMYLIVESWLPENEHRKKGDLKQDDKVYAKRFKKRWRNHMSVQKGIMCSQNGTPFCYKNNGIYGNYDDCVVKEGPFSHNILP